MCHGTLISTKVLFEYLLVSHENAEMVLNTAKGSAKSIIEMEFHRESDEKDEIDFIQNGANDIMEGLDAEHYDNIQQQH